MKKKTNHTYGYIPNPKIPLLSVETVLCVPQGTRRFILVNIDAWIMLTDKCNQ
jgi:hypothetical protein